MKRFYWQSFLSLTAILTLWIHPLNTVLASAQGTVTASAVIVPSQVTELGFIISAPVKEITVREGDQVKMGQTLVVLDTTELNFAVAAAEATLRFEQAEAKIQSYERILKYIHRRKRWVSVPHEVIEMANARVDRAQTSLEIAQVNLLQGTLLAPHDGTVTSINVTPGEFVRENGTIVTLATLNTFQIETIDLSERDIVKVKIGDPANIFIVALNENIGGKVIGISPIASRVEGDVVFKVTIAPDAQPEGLLWGMTAEVEIQSGD